jgi:hypothetical protein
METRKHMLTESDEMLIGKYADNECGFFSKIRARRLLARSQEARLFLESLHEYSTDIQAVDNMNKGAKVDLWNKISARIDQEERAEVFLGKRTQVNQENTRVSWSNLGWGLSGGFVTAGIAVVMFLSSSKFSSNLSTNKDDFANRMKRSLEILDAQGNARESVQPEMIINTSSNQSGSNRLRKPLELDWMRSDGSVRLIQAPQEKSAIIWVKRRNPIARGLADDLSEQALINNDRPVLLKERIPETFSISSK